MRTSALATHSLNSAPSRITSPVGTCLQQPTYVPTSLPLLASPVLISCGRPAARGTHASCCHCWVLSAFPLQLRLAPLGQPHTAINYRMGGRLHCHFKIPRSLKRSQNRSMYRLAFTLRQAASMPGGSHASWYQCQAGASSDEVLRRRRRLAWPLLLCVFVAGHRIHLRSIQ